MGPQKTLSFLFDVQGNPQQHLKDKGVINSGYSRHMTRNISFLSDFKEFNGGYVTFEGNPKGAKISSKDTECIILSSDYKLPDESHVLLRVPRENNIYNVDLKNVVPSGDLTCLFVKAKLDESNLLHRRLGHINFKAMNKLVKGNLVKGLPSKIFENNHTCVACKKGKQHRASWIGPTWLFDIDTLTKSMNYQPVVAGNQPNDNAAIKENLDADPQNTYDDDAFDVKENKNDVYVFANGSDKSDSKKHDENAKRDANGKRPANPTNSTNSFNTGSPSDTAISPNFGIARKSSFTDPSKYSDDPDMPKLVDIIYSDDEEDVVFRNKKDERGTVIRNKARLVAQGHTQEEGIDYDEVFDPVARIEAVCQDKYVAKILRKFGFTDVKSVSTPIKIEKPLLKDPDGEDVNVHIYRQFWATATIKKVNDIVQLRVLNDGKKVIVTEDVIKRDLHLDDADGVECLPNEEIFTELAHPTPTPHATPPASPPQEQPTLPHDSTMPLLTTLMETYTSLSKKVVELEQDKNAQALEILKLKKRVKKLEKKKRSKHSGRMHPNRGKIEAIDADEDITLVYVEKDEEAVTMDDELQGRIDQDGVNAASKGVNVIEPIVFDDEEVTMTMAQTLFKMKEEKAKLLDKQMAQRLHDEEVEKAAAIEKQEKDDLERAKVLQKYYEDKEENIDWNVVVDQVQERHLDNIRKY
nr:hypothetical protein [Tanacetum cinerariifolium]